MIVEAHPSARTTGRHFRTPTATPVTISVSTRHAPAAGAARPIRADVLHPFLTHYQTHNADGTCTNTGTTGNWHAANGNSAGWQQFSIDLSPYAGSQVEVSITVLSDLLLQAVLFRAHRSPRLSQASSSYSRARIVPGSMRITAPGAYSDTIRSVPSRPELAQPRAAPCRAARGPADRPPRARDRGDARVRRFAPTANRAERHVAAASNTGQPPSMTRCLWPSVTPSSAGSMSPRTVRTKAGDPHRQSRRRSYSRTARSPRGDERGRRSVSARSSRRSGPSRRSGWSRR